MSDPIDLIILLFRLIYITILGRIILTLVLSFIRTPPPILVRITQVLVQVTEPLLAPIRRVLPNTGMLDFSPMIAILLLVVIEMVLIKFLT